MVTCCLCCVSPSFTVIVLYKRRRPLTVLSCSSSLEFLFSVSFSHVFASWKDDSCALSRLLASCWYVRIFPLSIPYVRAQLLLTNACPCSPPSYPSSLAPHHRTQSHFFSFLLSRVSPPLLQITWLAEAPRLPRCALSCVPSS